LTKNATSPALRDAQQIPHLINTPAAVCGA